MPSGVNNGDERRLAEFLGGRVSLLAAAVAIAAGVLVLAGWATGTELLKRVQPGLVAMNPMTACCVLLAGAEIAFHYFGRPQLGGSFGMLIVAAAAGKRSSARW